MDIRAATTTAFPPLRYAGFWLRFVAYVIDGMIVGCVFLIIFGFLAAVTGIGSTLRNMRPGEDPGDVVALLGVTFIFAVLGIALVGVWLYYALLESSSWQGTLGKKVLGLAVTDTEGRRISFGRASGRYFAKFVTNLIPLFIGYILAGFTERKQAIHDMIAGCLVLRGT
jgi:uncharacterized RDD family membrane protein YckC